MKTGKSIRPSGAQGRNSPGTAGFMPGGAPLPDRLWAVACLATAAAWWLLKMNGWPELAALARFVAGLVPPGPHLLPNLARSIAAVLLAMALFLIYDSAGARLSRLATGHCLTGPGRLVTAPLAYGIMSLTLLGSAAVGLWHLPVLLFILAGFAFLGVAGIRDSFRTWAAEVKAVWNNSGAASRIGWMVLGLLAFLFATAPEVHPDCAQYHLAFPQQILALHHLPWTQVFWFWLLPLPAELPYVFPLLARNENISIVMMLAFASASALALVRSLPFRIPPAVAFAVALAGLALHDNCWTSFTAKNDLASAAFGLAGTALLLASGGCSRRDRLDRGMVLLGALLLGFCGTTKFVLMPLAGILAILPVLVRRRVRFGLALLSGAGLALPLLPWMARSFIQCGDPLFPAGTLALSGILGIPGRNRDIIAEFMLVQEKRAHGLFALDTGRAALLMCPVILAALPALLRARAWMALLPAVVMLPGIAAQFLLMPASSWAVYRFDYLAALIWNLTGFAALSGVATTTGDRERSSPLIPGLVAVAAGFSLLVGFSHTAWWHESSYQNYLDQASYPAGRASAEEYRLRGLFSYGSILPALKKASAGLPPGSSVIEAAETVCWDSPLRVRTDTVGPPPVWSVFAESASLTRVRARFRQMNARLLIFNSERNQFTATICEPYPWDARMLRLYADFAGEHMRLLASSGNCFDQYGTLWLYGILPRPAKPLKRILFLPGAERGFCRMKQFYYTKNFQEAVRVGLELRALLPELALIDLRLGEILFMGGQTEKGFELLDASVNEGLIHGRNLTQAMLAAVILKKDAEADRLYKMHLEWYPTRRADADSIKAMGKTIKKGSSISF